MKVIEGEKLALSGVQRSDMGGYLCIASNGIPPSVSKRYDVQVNCKWPISLNPSLAFYFIREPKIQWFLKIRKEAKNIINMMSKTAKRKLMNR